MPAALDHARGSGASSRRRACAPNTFTRWPPAAHHAPGRGLPARTTRTSSAAGRAGSSAELVDGRASRRRSARRPAARAARRRGRGSCSTQQRGAQRRRAGRAARPRSRRRRSACARSANTGPVSRPASSCMRHTPVSRVAREDRPLDRRRAAPARQQREVHVHEPERQRFEQRDRAAADRTRRPRRARRRSRATSSTISRALLGRAHRQPELVAARFTGDGSVPAPRERRRSGWVTTSAMSWPAATSARSGGTASSGVPR